MDAKKYFSATFKQKAIPSLDGLRTLSIALVVLGHVYIYDFMGGSIPASSFIYHDLGVSLFFVISGFLITTLLLDEFKATGRVSLRDFFIKRTFRIFPAFYLFLLVMILTQRYFYADIGSTDLVATVLYLGMYVSQPIEPLLAHSWSLAIEEQFYILWAPVFAFLVRHRRLALVLILAIFVAPLARGLTYKFTEIYKDRIHFLFHTRYDSLLCGCLLAVLARKEKYQTLFDRWVGAKTFALSLIFLFVANPFLASLFRGTYRGLAGYSLENVAFVCVLWYAIRNPESIAGTLLNSKPARHIGSISYGIYLWQQPFTVPSGNPFVDFPLNIFCIYIVALASFVLFEAPILRARGRFLKSEHG